MAANVSSQRPPSSGRSQSPSTRSQANKSASPGSRSKAQAGAAPPKAASRDSFKPSAELAESRRKGHSPGGCVKDAPKPGEPKPGEPKEPGLQSQVDGLQRQLDELRNGVRKTACQGCQKEQSQPEQPAKKSCNGGGKPPEAPKEAEKSKDSEKKDPDGELQSLAALVLAAMLQKGQGEGAAAGNPQSVKSNLQQKCEQLKGQGFQPKPETRATVAVALGGDPFAETGKQTPQAPAASSALPGRAPVLLDGLAKTA